MKKIPLVIMTLLLTCSAYAASYFGTALCAYPQYECLRVAPGQSWDRLFPDEEQRDVVQRLNRSYNPLWPGKVIAVPRNLDGMTIFDISPFPLKVKSRGEKQIIVDQEKLAWGAYDAKGNLVKWGPISSGRDKCSDSSRSCRTMTGIFRVFSKENEKCRSNVYPAGRGGAQMPYCMFFHKGYALHGSSDIPGYRASHGCVRMFVQDALWLNHEFVQTSTDQNNHKGTLVVVRPVISVEKR